MLVFAGGAGVSAYFARQAAEREREAKANERQAQENEQKAKDNAATANEFLAQLGHTVSDLNIEKGKLLDAEKANRRLLYAARMNLAGFALREGDYERVADLLRETFPKPGEEDFRGWEWHAVFRRIHPETRSRVLPDGAEVVSLDPLRLILTEEGEPPVLQTPDPDTPRALDRVRLPENGLDVTWGWAEDGGVATYRSPDSPHLVVYDVTRRQEVGRLKLVQVDPEAADPLRVWL